MSDKPLILKPPRGLSEIAKDIWSQALPHARFSRGYGRDLFFHYCSEVYSCGGCRAMVDFYHLPPEIHVETLAAQKKFEIKPLLGQLFKGVANVFELGERFGIPREITEQLIERVRAKAVEAEEEDEEW